MSKEKTEAQIDRSSRYGSPWQWIGAAAVGTTSAASTFINLVRTKFHDDSSFRQGFALLHTTKNRELLELADRQIDDSMKVMEGYIGNHNAYLRFADARQTINNATDELKQTKEYPQAIAEYHDAFKTMLKECGDEIDKAKQSKAYKKLASSFSKEMSGIKASNDHLNDLFAETAYGIRSVGIRGHIQGVWERFGGFSSYAQRNMLFKTAVALGVGFGGTMMVFNQLNTRDKLNEIDKQTERGERKTDAIAEKVGVMESEIKTRREHKENLKHAAKGEQPGMHIVGEGRRHDGMQRDEALEASL